VLLAAVARKPQVHFRGAFYHVISHGNHREMIFHGDLDSKRYLSLLEEVQNRYSCKLYARVLMGNHVHLLEEVGVAPFSKIMQNMQFRYTRYVNMKEGGMKRTVLWLAAFLSALWLHIKGVASCILIFSGKEKWGQAGLR
jgi:REP element-mobilizing transposase RayT